MERQSPAEHMLARVGPDNCKLWRLVEARVRRQDWDRLRDLAALNGMTRRGLLARLVQEYCDNPRLLGFK